MDRQAAKWCAILDNEEIDPETKLPIYGEAAKDRIFNRLQAWLKERKRLFPEEKPKEGAGVTDMRAWMNDPEGRAELEAMIRKISGTAHPPKPPANRARSKADETKKAAEGSALKALVFGGEGLETSE